jgi:hypothetical protein
MKKIVVRTSYYDYAELNIPIITVQVGDSRFYRDREEKWIEFCKKHNFNPHKDAYGKIYDLYLELCAEGLV